MNIARVLSEFPQPEELSDPHPVLVRGRVRLVRGFGKLSFLTINDGEASIQIGIRGKVVLPALWDTIEVTGTKGYTKSGERTIWTTEFKTIATCEAETASKFEGIEDRGILYNRRHFGLLANPEDLQLLRQRSKMVFKIRQFMDSRDFVRLKLLL